MAGWTQTMAGRKLTMVGRKLTMIGRKLTMIGKLLSVGCFLGIVDKFTNKQCPLLFSSCPPWLEIFYSIFLLILKYEFQTLTFTEISGFIKIP